MSTKEEAKYGKAGPVLNETLLQLQRLAESNKPAKRARRSQDSSKHQQRESVHDKNSHAQRKKQDSSQRNHPKHPQQTYNHDGTENLDDPFPWALRCAPITDPDRADVLWWFQPDPLIPVAAEEELEPILIRWGKRERRMMKDQPDFRLPKIQKKCRWLGVPLLSALSLRRHYMKRLNPHKRMSQLQLGSEDEIREAAELFERAVEGGLKYQKVLFFTEKEQRDNTKRHRPPDGPYPPTPDFLLKEPRQLRKYVYDKSNRRRIVEERVICWIEAKMFYGASTIEPDGKSAVGTILETARKYVRVFGPGAIVFLYGCGQGLAAQLEDLQVTVLDAGGATGCSNRENRVDLRPLERQQRQWCADRQGFILI